VDDTGVTFRAVLEAARRECAAEWVMQQLAECVPAALHRIVESILTAPASITSIQALADALGVHRKTLFNRCESAAFLAPAELLAWSRLALVGYLLETTGVTVERIAIELSYPSATALRNTVRRYTGLTASEVRVRGGVGCVIEALRRRLDSQARALGKLHLV
jgi:transcriptional regulator GlxA family with amidase domain